MKPIIIVAISLAGIDVQPATPAQSREVAIDQVLRIVRGKFEHDRGRMTTIAAEELMTNSATFADMMRRLSEQSDVVLYVTAALPFDGGLIGRSRFTFDDGRIVGIIELEHLPNVAIVDRGIALAHELAHAYEIVCLTSARTRTALRQVLARRVTRRGVETEFAIEVEGAVRREWQSVRRTASQLDALAARFGPMSTPTENAGTPGAGSRCGYSNPMIARSESEK